jgi:hypothetical protein
MAKSEMELSEPIPEALEANRRRAAELAHSVLTGAVSLLEAAPDLESALRALGCDWDDDSFRTFGLIASETDTLPIGPQRQHWAPEALARKEPDVLRAQAWAEKFGLAACKEVLARYGRPSGAPSSEGAI